MGAPKSNILYSSLQIMENVPGIGVVVVTVRMWNVQLLKKTGPPAKIIVAQVLTAPLSYRVILIPQYYYTSFPEVISWNSAYFHFEVSKHYYVRICMVMKNKNRKFCSPQMSHYRYLELELLYLVFNDILSFMVRYC